MSAPARPVMRYHGGKWRLAPWVIRHFPPHRVYVEPYGGGASVLLRKPRSYAEVLNDLDEEVVNVFRVLRDRASAAQLRELVRLTPYSRAEFELSHWPTDNPIERARRTVFRSFAGFGSASANPDHKTGFRGDVNRSHTTPAHDWMHYPDHVDAFTARLAGVVIEQRTAIDVIRQHDGPRTLYYVDPPYVHATRGWRRRNAAYRHEMTEHDHRALAAVLHAVQGMVMLSGYPCALYDEELYSGWERHERRHLADGARARTEVLWCNPACSASHAGRLAL